MMADEIKMDVPLFLRVLELVNEDIKEDVDLHVITDIAIDLSADGKTLTMDDYPKILDYLKEHGTDAKRHREEIENIRRLGGM